MTTTETDALARVDAAVDEVADALRAVKDSLAARGLVLQVEVVGQVTSAPLAGQPRALRQFRIQHARGTATEKRT